MITKNKIILNKKNINLGIEILRVIFCFWVLCSHCLELKKIDYIVRYIFISKSFHVPCFSFMSFFFTYNIFKFKNAIKLKNRLKRLLIPYIFWPLIIFAIFNISNLENISLYLLRNQLICGFEFIIQLWYLFSITLLSILVYILSNLFPNLFLFVIVFNFFLLFSIFRTL